MSGSNITLIGVDHSATSLDTVAQLHTRRRDGEAVVSLPAQAGAVRLATCHRLELYLEGPATPQAEPRFRAWLGAEATGREWHKELAGRHLLRVAAGLESAVLGEDQILTQVRQAYRAACEERTAGRLLHRLFHAAFRTGKRVRSETELAVGTRSLAGAAVAALNRALRGLRGKSFLVLGTGEMGAIAARQLSERGAAQVLLCNRTARRAEELASRLDVETRPWEWRQASLSQVDGAVCATGAQAPVVQARWLSEAAASRSRPLAVVDLGVPRNVEPVPVPPGGLVNIDIESLSRRMEEDRRRQTKAVAAAEAIVEDELQDWVAWAEAGRGVPSSEGPSCRVRRGLVAG